MQHIIKNFEQFVQLQHTNHLAESQDDEVKLKVDNSGHEKYYEFFKKNINLFKPHNSGQISPDQGVIHSTQNGKLEKAGKKIDWPYGYCYPISQFVFYSLGGYDSDWDLKLIKKLKYKFKGVNVHTTHWFVQHKTNGRIIDLTASQFDDIPDFNLMELYPLARRANLGFPHYRTENGKREFGHTVPSMQCLRLYDVWRGEHAQIKGLEKYWKAARYATERRPKINESYIPYTVDELSSIPEYELHCFII